MYQETLKKYLHMLTNKNQEKLINYTLTRFFACYGIPFWVIESPFFIDLLKNLNAGYTLPDQRTLSNLWIDQEVARITMIENDPRSLNDKLRNYITSREFWANIECLHKILELAKTAVQTVEASNTKIADVFLILIKMAIAIKAMPTTETTLERLEFRKKCIIFYNKRWAEFDTDFYLLAYFLHPKYRGKGLTSEIFQKILQKALSIWKSQGGKENSARELIAQIHNYDLKKPPYNSLFQDHIELLKTWWAACSKLAKLHAYYVTNARHELNYVGQDLPESDFLKMMHDYAYLLTSGTAIFEENIQLYDSEDDFEYNSEDNLDDSFEDSFEDNNLSEVNSNMLNIEDSINLEYASNNTNQLLTSDEVTDHGEKDFDIDALASQGMQMRSASIDVDKNG
ncbi:hypothetical protein C2G38_2046896 [Gigaspora rosea]|uniref:Uncharacterized protein n=1 Tax=Gigaspora rosea TaxID=44941 RepID=A0A397U7Z9_9GLOM|nr:hypothetical protein C2G38_2046896 [Gigaspora rosea]